MREGIAQATKSNHHHKHRKKKSSYLSTMCHRDAFSAIYMLLRHFFFASLFRLLSLMKYDFCTRTHFRIVEPFSFGRSECCRFAIVNALLNLWCQIILFVGFHIFGWVVSSPPFSQACCVFVAHRTVVCLLIKGDSKGENV